MCPHDLKIGRTKAYVGVSLASVFYFWRNLPDSHFPCVLTLAQLILLLFHLLFFPTALLTWDRPPSLNLRP